MLENRAKFEQSRVGNKSAIGIQKTRVQIENEGKVLEIKNISKKNLRTID